MNKIIGILFYFRRIGLSKRYLGEETYNKILDQINKDLPEDEKVNNIFRFIMVASWLNGNTLS